MPELNLEKLRYTVVIKNVPTYGNVFVVFYQVTDAAICFRTNKIEEVGGKIVIQLPLMYEGNVAIRLWRPDRPIPSLPHVRWKDNGSHCQVFHICTDEFKDGQYVIDDHRFANLEMEKTIFEDNIESSREPYPKKNLIKRAFGIIGRLIPKRMESTNGS